MTQSNDSRMEPQTVVWDMKVKDKKEDGIRGRDGNIRASETCTISGISDTASAVIVHISAATYSRTTLTHENLREPSPTRKSKRAVNDGVGERRSRWRYTRRRGGGGAAVKQGSFVSRQPRAELRMMSFAPPLHPNVQLSTKLSNFYFNRRDGNHLSSAAVCDRRIGAGRESVKFKCMFTQKEAEHKSFIIGNYKFKCSANRATRNQPEVGDERRDFLSDIGPWLPQFSLNDRWRSTGTLLVRT
ncbi:hypothetical protein B0H17DRAFT_1123995 [Mycena rosella]|uniref:Uncharacterized protein n=1 Tax=Mycena rosella TaxID=1033263 RepID=A0AAD7MCQ0_MYCRO|nr:hypothetical protein B0H17DRAFT_1123995 [Mycena rosella]